MPARKFEIGEYVELRTPQSHDIKFGRIVNVDNIGRVNRAGNCVPHFLVVFYHPWEDNSKKTPLLNTWSFRRQNHIWLTRNQLRLANLDHIDEHFPHMRLCEHTATDHMPRLQLAHLSDIPNEPKLKYSLKRCAP